MHLAPVLQQGAQAGGAKKRDAAHFDRDGFGARSDRIQNGDFQLIRPLAVTTTGYYYFMGIPMRAFLDDHKTYILRASLNPFLRSTTMAKWLVRRITAVIYLWRLWLTQPQRKRPKNQSECCVLIPF